MNVSASRSSSAVVTPGRTSRPSMSSVRATSLAAAPIASISRLSLRYTISTHPCRLRIAPRGAPQRLVHLVHRAPAEDRPQLPRGRVVVHQGRGLPPVLLEPAPHHVLGVVRAGLQRHLRVVVAVHAVPRRRPRRVVGALAPRPLAPAREAADELVRA